MVDIVDSVDVQVAYIKNSTMTSRSTPPYQYWVDKANKSDTSKVYVLAYTNPTDLCQTSFSPHIDGSNTAEDTCSFSTINPRTEAGMFQGFDYVESQLPLIKGGIHFMNGVFGSGITAGWPVHSANPTPSCSVSGTAPPTNSPTVSPSKKPSTDAPSKSPSKAPTPPKYLCQRNDPGDTQICDTGEVLGGQCNGKADGDSCGGNKKCWLADCTSGGPAPTPTDPPVGGPTPTTDCTLVQTGNSCKKGSDCCSGSCSGGQNKVCG